MTAMQPTSRSRLRIALLLASTALAGTAQAQSLPTGGSVAHGDVSIASPAANQMTIRQGSPTAIVNWQGFSIGQGATVDISQPSSGAMLLNRVTGGTRSTIAGQLRANGQVLLVNPNGIAITGTGSVSAAGFVASTLDITDSDFKAGRLSFEGRGASAEVSNAGAITIGRGGYAALIGGSVDNAGTISVPLGKVGLGSGERVTLDLAGDGFLQVAVPTKAAGDKALVEQSGRISADGGSVEIKAASVREAARRAINMTGVVEARTVSGRPGSIVLGGGGGKVRVTGKLDASARAGGKGGKIKVTGRKVKLKGATVDASGAAGGGEVRIGGDYRGGGTLERSIATEVDNGSVILVDALSSGDGGSVVVWSDDTTHFAGRISGRSATGDGGFAEVSGKAHVTVNGTVDLAAPAGKAGTFLIDPGSVSIVSGANAQNGMDTFTTGFINAQLASSNLVIDTNYASGSNGATGDITLTTGANISWTGATTLTLNAARDIVFQTGSSITANGGSVVLSADSDANYTGRVSFLGAGAQVAVSNGGTVSAYYNPVVFGTADFQTGSVSGPLTAHMLINDYNQLVAINGNPTGTYALNRDIDRGTFTGTSGNFHFPIGTFNGILDGRNHNVNFSIRNTNSSESGLFHAIGASGVVRNLRVSGFYRSGSRLGGMAAYNYGLIENSHASLTVPLQFDPNLSGNSVGATGVISGGMVSYNFAGGIIRNSTAAVDTGVGFMIGGLAGVNRGTIEGSGSWGSVRIGQTTGFEQSVMGGLVGLNEGNITNSWSTANVSDVGNVTSYDGGFVGWHNGGAIRGSFSTGFVNGGFLVGGFVGSASPGTVIDGSFSLSNMNARTRQNAGGFAGRLQDGGTITNSYATGSIGSNGSNDSTVGAGFVGSAYQPNVIMTGNYWDATTSGLTTNHGGGATMIQSATPGVGYAFTQNTYSGFDFTTKWYMVSGFTRPMPRGFATSDIGQVAAGVESYGRDLVSAMQLQLVGANLAGNYRLTRDLDLAVVNSSILWAGRGFGSIGARSASDGTLADYSGPGLTGRFDGQGHVLRNFVINAPGYNGTALFVRVGTGGVLENLGLESGSITGQQAGGAIASTNRGTIRNVYSKLDVYGTNNVGGLVSFNEGVISGAYVTGNVTAAVTSSNTGGIVANNSDLGTIRDAYMLGDVTGGMTTNLPNIDNTGGIAGSSYGLIERVYATGLVSGNGRVGALVGETTASYWNGFEMVVANGQLLNAHWNVETSGQASARGNTPGTHTGNALTTAQMQDLSAFQTNFSGFDFLSVWAPPNQAGQGGLATAYYPGLYALDPIAWVDPDDASRVYGEANPAFTGTLIAGGASPYMGTVAADWLDMSSALASVGTNANVGGHAITGSASAASRRGTAFRVVVSDGTLTVTPKALTVSGNKAYDGTTAFDSSSFVASGAVAGETVSFTAGSGTATNSNAGTYAGSTFSGLAINVAGGNGLASNYTFNTTGTLTIDKALLTVTGNKDYDGNAAFGTGTLVVNGVAAGETVTINTGSATTSSANADTYAGTALSGLSIGVTGGNALAANYQLPTTGTFTIDPKAITVTGSATRLYGDANPATTTTAFANGLVGLDSISSVAITGGPAANADIGAYSFTPASVSFAAGNAANYAITYVDGSLSVTARPVTVTADARSKFYGNANPALTYATTGLGAGAPLNGALATLANGASGVGAYAITQGGLTNANNPNYLITYVGADLTVNRRPVTVTADARSKSYGDANPALTFSTSDLGFGEAVAGSLATTAGDTSPFGAYAITQGSVTDANNANYVITYVGADLTVNRRAITVTADAKSKSYGDANPALTYTSSSLGFGVALVGDLFTAAGDASGVGAYAIEQGTLVDADNANYQITYVGADLTVGRRAVTVTADARTKTYGDANPALTYTHSSLGAGVALVGALSTAAGNASGVGDHAIEQGSVTNAGNANYDITYVGADLTITRRAVTVTADAKSMTYGDAVPALTFATTDLGFGTAVLGDLFASADGAGVHAIEQGTVTNASNANYDITYVGADLTVGKRAITVTADAKSKSYGDANPVLTFATSNLGSGVAVVGGLTTTADAASGVGAYAITQGTVTDANNANYEITYVGADLTVGRRAITVTADAKSKAYGDANPALTYTTSSLGAGMAVQGSLATLAGNTSGVGAYAIEEGTVTNLVNANYDITYVGADLTVNRRAVTVTADAKSKDYGDANPALTFTHSSLGYGTALVGSLTTSAGNTSIVGAYAIEQGSVTDAINANYAITYAGADLTVNRRAVTVTADATSKTYGDANPALTFTTSDLGFGTAILGSLTTSAGNASGVGAYAIEQGSVTDATNSNYAITYVGADLAVNRRAVTVTADAKTKIYGDANPALTFTTSSLGYGAALLGSLSTAAGNASPVGLYAIGQGSVTDATNANYAITYAGADLTVNRRAVTVTADAKARSYGDANPALTFTTSDLGFGAAILGDLVTSAGPASAVGTYAIAQGGVTDAANPNYAVTYVGADLAVNRRAVTVTADAKTRFVGQPNPTLTYAHTSLGAGAPLSGTLEVSADVASAIGLYAIGQGTLTDAANPNYLVTYVGANLEILPSQPSSTLLASTVYWSGIPVLEPAPPQWSGAGAELSDPRFGLE